MTRLIRTKSKRPVSFSREWFIPIILCGTVIIVSCAPATSTQLQGQAGTDGIILTGTGTPVIDPQIPTPTASSVPTPTIIPSTPLQIATSRDIASGFWSPDEKWISFMVLTDEEPSPKGFKMTPAFYNVETGETCFHDDLAGVFYSSNSPTYLFWQRDGSPAVISNNQPYTGTPCGEFQPISDVLYPWEWSVSPDGRYRQETRFDEATATGTTTLIDNATNTVLNKFTWRHSMIGGSVVQWVGNEYLLVMTSDDRGPLLASIDGSVTEVISDLFGMKIGKSPTTYWASGALDQATGDFHILLDTNSVTTEREPLLLYHSETGEVEEIPFRTFGSFSTWQHSIWGFSEDGGWLLLGMPMGQPLRGTESYARSSTPVGQPGDDYITDWTRPVDGRNDEAFVLAQAGGSFHWSGPTGLVAFNEMAAGTSRNVSVMTFPEGQIVQQWSVDGYWLGPQTWSPSGKKLLLMGYSEESGTSALFLADVAP